MKLQKAIYLYQMKEITLVLGVSLNPQRHSYRTVASLAKEGFNVMALGSGDGEISGITVQKGKPKLPGIHTISLYLKPERQDEYLDYILALNPQRIIFNKKTYNPTLWEAAKEKGIRVMEDCTLVMLAKGVYWGD